MTYSEFVSAQKENPSEVALKTNNTDMTNLLLDDINLPAFYSDVAGFEDLVLYQGAFFLDRPHYDHKEQILCALDSYLSVVLVPLVYRQEIETGNKLNFVNSVYMENDYFSRRTSPINFFHPNWEKFIHFKSRMRKVIFMEPGDCVFIPAFYFYQMRGSKDPHRVDEMKNDDVNKATAVSLKFGSNSDLLTGFYQAVERNLIK